MCHALELLFICFMSVKSSSSANECRKASSFCYKVERLEKEVKKSSETEADLKNGIFYFLSTN